MMGDGGPLEMVNAKRGNAVADSPVTRKGV
jgi:hypothetical protein